MTKSVVPTDVRPLVPYWPKLINGKQNFGPKFVRYAMPWFEALWLSRGTYPSAEQIIGRFGCSVEDVQRLNQHKFWLRALDNRGIQLPLAREELSAKQVAAISLLTNFNAVEPVAIKLARIGVSEEQLQGWYKQPLFKRTLQETVESTLGDVGPDATTELARLIKKGDFRAIKFYFEITGQATSPEVVNVRQAMTILIEAVQKHVKDPAVKEAIAAEVQAMRSIKGL